MKVRATAIGFYEGRRRYPGDTFKVPDGAKAKWFEPVSAPVEPAVEAPAPRAPRAKAKAAPAEEQGAGDLV
jgi:hypothetical protein